MWVAVVVMAGEWLCESGSGGLERCVIRVT